ncbi:hypothetical protein QYE76_068370 [Lolium multiflorum]|uniref:Reverse transcriptase Ty1/copia-type domain-containing protein n=1 Tax=Lolium multiflorum TaxID=4521 RepID=A0AAD8SGM4_LOLMU|nr:hypothetical protein QYE76_068370 [Lolium multiflorum]
MLRGPTPFASFSSRTPSSRKPKPRRDPHEGYNRLCGGEHERERALPGGDPWKFPPRGENRRIAIVIERDIISIIIIIISTIYTAITTAAPLNPSSKLLPTPSAPRWDRHSYLSKILRYTPYTCGSSYVDDIILTASTAGLLRQLTDRLRAEFALKDLGPLHYFLGIEVVRRADGFFLHQRNAHELLERAGMLNATLRLLLSTRRPSSPPDGSLASDAPFYRSIVGALHA